MYPHVTVATVIHQDKKYLMVREESDGEIVINQPAGHLELGESLIDAAKRETYEETGWRVNITGFLGVSQFTSPANGVTYIRHTFIAEPKSFDAKAKLDKEIIEAVWLSMDDLQREKKNLRSPMVMHDIQRFAKGKVLPLDTIAVLSV